MRLRVVSYNIHRAIGVDRRFRPERIVHILKSHDADVVLLQEVDDGVTRSRELDLARESNRFSVWRASRGIFARTSS